MADLTVLTLPSPLPPHPSLSRSPFSASTFSSRASSSKLSLVNSPGKVRPTLSKIDVSDINIKGKQKAQETDDASENNDETSDQSESSSPAHESPEPGSTVTDIISPMPVVASRHTSMHRPTRSQSAPPERIRFDAEESGITTRSHTYAPSSSPHHAATAGTFPQFSPSLRRGFSTFNHSPLSYNAQKRAPGEPVKPPPPLHRPTTFWRRTPRSGVTSSSFSPSTYLMRRSTFIAAGLSFDKPVYDVSALGVESRIVNDAMSGKVTETFWEVIEAR